MPPGIALRYRSAKLLFCRHGWLGKTGRIGARSDTHWDFRIRNAPCSFAGRYRTCLTCLVERQRSASHSMPHAEAQLLHCRLRRPQRFQDRCCNGKPRCSAAAYGQFSGAPAPRLPDTWIAKAPFNHFRGLRTTDAAAEYDQNRQLSEKLDERTRDLFWWQTRTFGIGMGLAFLSVVVPVAISKLQIGEPSRSPQAPYLWAVYGVGLLKSITALVGPSAAAVA
jgi:hypothetical protein